VEELIMDVNEIFQFADGRTVFVGMIHNHPDLIPACNAMLKIGENLVQRIKIDGEFMIEKRTHFEKRAVATLDSLDVPIELLRSGHAQLEFQDTSEKNRFNIEPIKHKE
jgi:hypothetical protein